MKLVIFGLTLSSSWGNGHATLWRALCRALHRRGHEVVFFERDVPYHSEHRDLEAPGYAALVLFGDWRSVEPVARRHVAEADVAMVTSFCPDGLAASTLVCESCPGRSVFYDLDTPVTLDALATGRRPGWIGPRGLRDFDLVLSYTGGAALEELLGRLGAGAVAALYGSVDPEVHRPVAADPELRADLSYLGTYAADRQAALEALFIEPARQRPAQRFLIGGAKYPPEFPWAENIFFARHVAPWRHAVFFSSSRLTLNITRAAMKRMGHCPSGRLFEAAACGAPILSDTWEGLGEFFQAGKEILVASSTAEAISALDLSDAELSRIAVAARGRVLARHTADHRAAELEQLLARAPAVSAAHIAGGGR